jgi:site-specific recombinase XerD
MAQQSHSGHVAQDYFCDINRSFLNRYGSGVGSVSLVAAACAVRQEFSMTKHISPLRQRMIDDMTIRNMSPSTQKVYTYAVANFSAFHRRSPDKLTFEDVRVYRLQLISRGLKPNSINPIMGALRFFYGTTLGLKEVSEHIPYARRPDILPAVMAPDDVVRFLKAVPDLKMRTLFIAIYAAGLRVSEAVKLTARDIDSARMVIIIRQAKGRKDRYVMLSEQLLGILRAYWKQAHLQHLLFPGPDRSRPITTRSVQRACRQAVEAAGLDNSITVHTLRHSFATHLLEQGVDIHVIQDLLGHRNIASTTRYARVAINTIRKIQSPLELLNMELAAPA